MGPDVVLQLCTQALELALRVGLPLLVVGLVVGLAVSVFQAVTQIQEQTLSFIPKIVALVVVIAIAGPWMLSSVVDWTHDLWGNIPQTVDFKPVGGDGG